MALLCPEPCSLYPVFMIRVGVIGFGLAGRIFHTAVVDATPGLELAGIVQRKGDEAAKAYPNAKIFRSIEELLADDSITLIVVATPSDSHFAVAEQCLKANRDVVIDKPFTLTSEEAATLIHLAREKKRLLSAYQNRRWDGDFLTVCKVLDSGELGRLVSYDAHYDRYRTEPRLGVWRENGGPGGGLLYDLGPHLVDQALFLFGAPETLFADVRVDRDNAVIDDAFDIYLHYPKLTVVLRSTLTAAIPRARFVLHGTAGSFVKYGLDPQEDQLKAGQAFDSPGFGHEQQDTWGELLIHGHAARRIETLPGDYRGLYASVRDALLGKAELAIKPEDAWRTARIIELARQSSSERKVLHVDFSNQP